MKKSGNMGDKVRSNILPTPKNVLEIVQKYLLENGFDGLCSDECGCKITRLAECESDCSKCVPGYMVVCDGNCTHDAPTDWHIQTEKPEQEEQ